MHEPDDQSLRKDILDAMATVQDPGMRVVLMLLHRGLDSINRKIDLVLADEDKWKTMVLNGGAATHTDEHHWMRAFAAEWTEYKPMMDIVKDRHHNGGHCDYAKRMIDLEKDDAQSKRRVRDGVIEKLLWVAILLTTGALGSKYLGL